MKFKLFSLSMLLFLATFATAQLSPVSWSYSAEEINAEEYHLVFTADIENGWYVYSQFLEEGGPIPTEFTFTEREGATMVGKIEESGANKKEGFDQIFEMNLIKYGDQVKFTQKIKVNADTKTIKGYLTFMTCNDGSCLPPRDIEFELELEEGM